MKAIAAIILAISTAGCITTTSLDYMKSPDTSGSKPIESKRVAFKFVRNTLTSWSGKFDKHDADTSLKGAWAAPQAESVSLHQFCSVFNGLTKSSTRTFASDENDCDIMMNITVQNGWNAWTLPFSFISGFTWATIPCWGDDNYTLYVEADNHNGLKKTYQYTSSVTTITWLPFIFGTPITGLPSTRINEITIENWQELKRQMITDGFFDKK
jgi:hypothetical protein